MIFDNYRELYKLLFHSCNTMITVNNAPQSEAYGNYFEYGPGGTIRMFDGYSNPVNFTGTASYISGNTITGTPTGPLGGGGGAPEYGGIVVDREGNIWVNNNKEIIEFDDSGIFLQRITAKSAGGVPASNLNPTGPKAFGAFPGLSGIAVDPTNGHVLIFDRAGFKIDEFSGDGKFIGQVDGTDTPEGTFGYHCFESTSSSVTQMHSGSPSTRTATSTSPTTSTASSRSSGRRLRSRKSATNRTPTRPPPAAPSTRRSTPTVPGRSPPARSNTAPSSNSNTTNSKKKPPATRPRSAPRPRSTPTSPA